MFPGDADVASSGPYFEKYSSGETPVLFFYVTVHTAYIIVCLLVSFPKEHVLIRGKGYCVINLYNPALGTEPGT